MFSSARLSFGRRDDRLRAPASQARRNPALLVMAAWRRPSRSPAGTSTCAATTAQACRRARARLTGAPTSMPRNAPPVMEPLAKAKAACRGWSGGAGSLRDERPEPTVGSYWPFAPTLWDYINRAMPTAAPHTLSADDVYALTAYILSLNDLVPRDFVADGTACRKSKCATATISSGPTRGPIRPQSPA